MTTKQFTIFTIAVIVAIFLSFGSHARAQQFGGGIVMLNPQTTIAGCAWPTAFATVTSGLAVCPLNTTTGPAIALAVNGGGFTQVPMAQGMATVTGTTPIVVTNGVISCPTCVVAPVVTSVNGKTGAVTLAATTTATTTVQ